MSGIKIMCLIKTKAMEGVPRFSCSEDLRRPRVRQCWSWGVSQGSEACSGLGCLCTGLTSSHDTWM